MPIERYQGGGLVPSRTSRAVARINSGADIDAAVINAKAEIEMVKLDNVTAITANAARRAAELTRLETALVELAPAASGRVGAIVDIGCLALSEVVANSSRRIGR